MTDLEKLSNIIEYAYTSVPFYKKRYDIGSGTSFLKSDPVKFIQKLPIIEKDDVRRYAAELTSHDFETNLRSKSLITKSTSGSTGKCLHIYWSRRDDVLTNFEAWRYRQKWYGITPKDKYATFHTTMYMGNRFLAEKEFTVEDNRHISFNKLLLSKATSNEYLKKINIFGASILLTQPSVLELFIRTANKETMHILRGLKYIELIGEYCSPEFLEYVQRMLPTVLISNMYGTTETGYVALTCRHGHQHILGNAFVEVLNYDNAPTSECGRLIVTSLTNYAMPFIRYNIGDRGIVVPSNCECGYKGYDLIITQGRESDFVSVPEDEQKPAYTLWYPIERINSEFGNPIISYHFIQKKKDLMFVFLSIKQEFLPWSAIIESSLVKALKDDISPKIEYQISFVEHSFSKCQKLKFFENQISL